MHIAEGSLRSREATSSWGRPHGRFPCGPDGPAQHLAAWPSSSASYRVAWYAVMDGVSSRLSSPLKGGREIACKAPLSVPWLVGFSTLFFSTILLSQEFPIYRHQRQPSTIRFLWTNQIHASTGGF